MRFAAIFIVAALAGCAAPGQWGWVRLAPEAPDLTKSQAECRLQAEAGAGPSTGGLVQMVDRNVHRDRLMVLCMQVKGWDWRRV